MGLTSGPTARMTKAGKATDVASSPTPPQSPEQCSETRGWLEHEVGGRREAFSLLTLGPESHHEPGLSLRCSPPEGTLSLFLPSHGVTGS